MAWCSPRRWRAACPSYRHDHGGALAETAPDAACLKVPPEDNDALRAALARMINDPALRRGKADAAWALAATLPRWDDTARIVAGVLHRLAAEPY